MGLLWALAAARFVAYGWVEALYLEPAWHFAWVPWAVVPPAPALYGLFGVMAVAGLTLAAGVRPRLSAAAFLLAFGYVELLDKALYLNHYVLVTLLAATFVALPAPGPGFTQPRWALWLLRVEVGAVYVWAGVAKLNPDWLLRGEPLRTWLAARVDLPGVGPLLAAPEAALAMSWAGAAYDLSVPFALSWARTRPWAYACVIAFHVTTWLLFPIGIFPWLMIAASTIFFPPQWPRRFREAPPADLSERLPLTMPATSAFWAVVLLLALAPGRGALTPMATNWSEEGFRFAWRVMLIEKTGQVDFRVVERDTGRTWMEHPADGLTALQHKQMRTQPDLIRQYARHLAAQYAVRGLDVAVYADAWASLNGRPSQRLLRPDVDLTLPDGALEAAGWIVPLEEGQG
ncbi:MAG: HTTM domain-containing protein [Alphaproteobacteria bacterium]|nr:HTTM domain-containing protein [Alphaproteobacteria bacterium]